jgi:hypothetical protein
VRVAVMAMTLMMFGGFFHGLEATMDRLADHVLELEGRVVNAKSLPQNSIDAVED